MHTTALLATITLATSSVAQAIPADTELRRTLTGLQYSVLKPGDGELPRRGDTVEVHYTGWLQDGTKFDTSRGGEPASFVVGTMLLRAWNEALQLMKPGARWKLTVPPNLGFGARGNPPRVPPHSTVIYEIELLSLKPRPRAPAFVRPDPTQQTATASGLKIQKLKTAADDAPAPGDNDWFEVVYTFWDGDGQLEQSSVPQGLGMFGKREHIALGFLREVTGLMKLGSEWLVEVPPIASKPGVPGVDYPTIWRLELTRIVSPPSFESPPADELTTTESGLRYKVLARNPDENAPKIELGKTVHVHYTGWLADGTQFESSYDGTRMLSFQLAEGAVISGWIEGLQLMREGDSLLLVIPPELGYGKAGNGPIPADATIVFAIYVHKVE